MRISHESPICLLDESRKFNDYDYALVHLFEEYPKYYEFFQKSVEMGREVLLDNSIFELGVSFSPERFAYWIEQLKPTSYIIPDVLEDMKGTIRSASKWIRTYRDIKSEKIGVVQGRTVLEIIECYEKLIRLGIERVAIPFDYSLYERIFPHSNKLVSWAFGRVALINYLIEEEIIDYEVEHHLLGCALPLEFSFYRDDRYSFLTSLDTSNPIMMSLDNKDYEHYIPLLEKPKTKLFELIKCDMTVEQYHLVLKNTKYFRKLVKL